jgi:hypothetical protein
LRCESKVSVTDASVSKTARSPSTWTSARIPGSPTLGLPPIENPEKIPERFRPLTDTSTAEVSDDGGTTIIAIARVCRLHLLPGLHTRRNSEELE